MPKYVGETVTNGDEKHPIFTDTEIQSLARKGRKLVTRGPNEYSERFKNEIKTEKGTFIFDFTKDYFSEAAGELLVGHVDLDPNIDTLPADERKLAIRQLVGIA